MPCAIPILKIRLISGRLSMSWLIYISSSFMMDSVDCVVRIPTQGGLS